MRNACDIRLMTPKQNTTNLGVKYKTYDPHKTQDLHTTYRTNQQDIRHNSYDMNKTYGIRQKTETRHATYIRHTP